MSAAIRSAARAASSTKSRIRSATSPASRTAGCRSATTSLNPLHRTPEEIETLARQKEAERERKETAERNKLIARADAVGLEYDDDWTLEKFKIEVPLAEQRAKDAEERKVLLAQARELKMVVDDDWDNKTFKEEIKEERAFQKADGDYQEACADIRKRWSTTSGISPTGRMRVPEPFVPTHHAFQGIPDQHPVYLLEMRRGVHRDHGNGALDGPAAPKEPQPPKRKPSLLKRIFG